MALKLNDKEITALAKKLAEKQKSAIQKENGEIIKKHLAAAKKHLAVFRAFPREVQKAITRYDVDLNEQGIARALAGSTLKAADVDSRAFESDIVLAAHDCATLASLCKKLGL